MGMMVEGYGAMSLEDWMGWVACTAYDGVRTEFPVLFENKPGQADPAAAPCRWDIDICGGHSEAGDAYGRSSGGRRAGAVQPGVWGREEDGDGFTLIAETPRQSEATRRRRSRVSSPGMMSLVIGT